MINISNLLFPDGGNPDVKELYIKIAINNVVESYRHILDKDIGYKRIDLYNTALASLLVLWIKENPPSKFKKSLPSGVGFFVVDIAIIKGDLKIEDGSFIKHEWVDIGDNPLDFTVPSGREFKKNRAILDISPYLEGKITGDKLNHRCCSMVDSDGISQRLKTKFKKLNGEETLLDKYLSSIFNSNN